MPITRPVESVPSVLDKLDADVPDDLDVNETVDEWFEAFKNVCESGDVNSLTNVIAEGAFWRDILALTWAFCTFQGIPKIKKFFGDRLALAEMKDFKLKNPSYAELQRPFSDLAWIQALFEFETSVGLCSGVVRRIP